MIPFPSVVFIEYIHQPSIPENSKVDRLAELQ
jgi:hypothetical protein